MAALAAALSFPPRRGASMLRGARPRRRERAAGGAGRPAAANAAACAVPVGRSFRCPVCLSPAKGLRPLSAPALPGRSGVTAECISLRGRAAAEQGFSEPGWALRDLWSVRPELRRVRSSLELGLESEECPAEVETLFLMLEKICST